MKQLTIDIKKENNEEKALPEEWLECFANEGELEKLASDIKLGVVGYPKKGKTYHYQGIILYNNEAKGEYNKYYPLSDIAKLLKNKKFVITPCVEFKPEFRIGGTFKWDKDYKRYGAKGITFDWKTYDDFKKDMYQPFLKHVKKHGEKNTTIDRIDNSKGYSKDNCRWITMKEQHRNKTTNRYIEYKGENLIIADWARKLKCSRQALKYRIDQGWDIETALTTPFKHSNKYEIISTPKRNS